MKVQDVVVVGKLDEKEIQGYIDYLEQKGKLKELKITVDGEYVDLKYKREALPVERIRRITGYLVGTMDKWNNGKKAEEKDRVMHS